MTNRYALLIIAALIIFIGNTKADKYRVDKKGSSIVNPENVTFNVPSSFYTGPAMTYCTQTIYNNDNTIGPEIPVLSGYYDWQTNGDCKHYIFWSSNSLMHAVYMASTDSANLNSTRKSKYAISTNGGTNWTDLGEIPTLRSGYPVITIGTTGTSLGTAILANHYQPGSQLTTGVHVDLAPGIGSFSSFLWNFNVSNFIWPQVNTMTNGKVLLGAETYQGAAATDTGMTIIFDPNVTSNNWSNQKFIMSTATSQLNMRWATAAGPNGRCIYVLDAINDLGGSFGGNRIFYWTSNDNGVTWSNQNLLFDTYVDPAGDTVTCWLGVDAVYDNAGNFYIAFNAIGDSLQTARIMVSKNGAAAVTVAKNLDIPDAMHSWIGVTQGNAISMDWPSLSVSDDDNYVFCAFSVLKQNDTVNGFQSGDIYYSFSPASALNFSGNLVQVTSGKNDERFAMLHRKALTESGSTYVLHLGYQKDPQPGSAAFNDNAPISKATLIYRKITQAQIIGIQNIGNEIPGQYSLSQNYPNPFNPTTRISFSLPKNSYVTLKVFDLLGREVARILDNKYILAGNKEVDFNASSLSSGVYFYEINAGTFTNTKKMVLVK